MDSNPKLSVIVPIFNTKNYITKCVHSIIGQTYTNLEILLIDDGSTDGSSDLCDSMREIDDRIVVIHKENGGQLSARKKGVSFCTGDYIVSVDSDDWIEPTRFEHVVKKGLSKKPDMVYIDGCIKEFGEEYEKELFFSPQDIIEYRGDQIRKDFFELLVGDTFFLDRRVSLSHVKTCIKRKIYLDNLLSVNEDIRRVEDAITILSCLVDCDYIVAIGEPSYHYIQRNGSINRQTTDWDKEHARKYYDQLRLIEEKSKSIMGPVLERVLIQFAFYNLFLTNYKRVYDYYTSCLFPYSNIKNGDRIIVYGAGNLGVEIVNAIDSDERFQIVAWVDKTGKKNPRSSRVVEKIEVIHNRNFDYIIVAVLVSSVALKIRNDLVDLGISKNKILVMRCNAMAQEDLEQLFFN